jgi:glycosyltransferase involved in cell wall biosynthesis
MRVLSIFHEGSLTGAPLAGLRTAKVLQRIAKSDCWIGGRLSPSFEKHSVSVMGAPPSTGPIDISKYDVFVCHSAASAPIVSRLLDAKARVIWWIHEDTHFFDVLAPRQINRCLLHSHALIYVSSHCAYRTFAHWTWARESKNVYVIPNFIPNDAIPLLRPGLQPARDASESLSVLHVGTLGRLKGTDLVLEAATKCQEQLLPIRFGLIGKVIDPDIARGLPQNTRWLGEIQADEIYRLMANSDVLLHPSRLDNQPLVVLEALAAGMQVVCSHLPSLQEYLGGIPGFHTLSKGQSQPTAEIVSRLQITAADRVRVELPYSFSQTALEAQLTRIFEDLGFKVV